MSKGEKGVVVYKKRLRNVASNCYTTETRFVLTNGFNGLLFVSCVTTVCLQQNNLETIYGSHMYFPENCLLYAVMHERMNESPFASGLPHFAQAICKADINYFGIRE